MLVEDTWGDDVHRMAPAPSSRPMWSRYPMRGLPTYGMRDSVVRTTCPVVLYRCGRRLGRVPVPVAMAAAIRTVGLTKTVDVEGNHVRCQVIGSVEPLLGVLVDRKSTRLNSSHLGISYAVFWLKKGDSFQRDAEIQQMPGQRNFFRRGQLDGGCWRVNVECFRRPSENFFKPRGGPLKIPLFLAPAR